MDKFLIELEDQLEEKKVEVQFGETVRKYLAKKGFDPLMGLDRCNVDTRLNSKNLS